jgi:hypothetical protein
MISFCFQILLLSSFIAILVNAAHFELEYLNTIHPHSKDTLRCQHMKEKIVPLAPSATANSFTLDCVAKINLPEI